MPLSSRAPQVPPLFVLAGLLGDTADPTPPPPEAVALLQLKALDPRCIGPAIDPRDDLREALLHDDFLHTAADGSWHGRAAYLQQGLGGEALPGGRLEAMQLRQFGPVALVHATWTLPDHRAAPSALRGTNVYLWNGRAWRLVSRQDTAVRAGVPLPLQQGPALQIDAWRGQDPTGDDEAVLTQLNASYVQAFREADVVWYDAHLAADYTVFSGDGTWNDRAAALAVFARPTFATSLASFPVDQVQVRRFADVALIHAENAYRLQDGRHGVNRYTDIWHRQAGRWRCVHAHITVHRAPTA
jgi:ketosteroid isomerase-like protein